MYLFLLPEMLKTAGEEQVELARQLTEAVFSFSVIPSDWEERTSKRARGPRQQSWSHNPMDLWHQRER